MIITAEQHEQVAATLATIKLGHGHGTQTKPCTIVAINMALTGKLTDQPHPCMSLAVRSWVIRVQDAMPVKMMEADDEHGIRWRQAAVDIAGSNDGRDEERRVLILDWMWECLSRKWQEWVPLSAHRTWATMLAERTPAAAERAVDAAAYAAYAASAKRAADGVSASYAADAAAYAATAKRAHYAADDTPAAVDDAFAVRRDAARDAYYAAYLARAVAAAVDAAVDATSTYDAARNATYDAYHALDAAVDAATAKRAHYATLDTPAAALAATYDAYYDAYHAAYHAADAYYDASAKRALDDAVAKYAADAAADAAGAAAASASADGVWRHFDPAALLDQLVHLP